MFCRDVQMAAKLKKNVTNTHLFRIISLSQNFSTTTMLMNHFLKKNATIIFVLLLAALLALLYLLLSKPALKSREPSIRVTANQVSITPDTTLGADQVSISVFNSSGSLIRKSDLSSPFPQAFTVDFEGNTSLRFEMAYSRNGQRIGPPSDNFIVIPPVGVPIIGADVPAGKSSTVFSPGSDWCNCSFTATSLQNPCTPSPYWWQYSIGAGNGSDGVYRVEVTKNTNTGGTSTATTSRFLLRLETTTSSPFVNALYYNAYNMNCPNSSNVQELSPDPAFSLQAFGKALYFNSTSLKYTCQVQRFVDCGNVESDRFIIVKCDDTPPPTGTTVTYMVDVKKAPLSVCGGGSF
jgi:hypothetical protein